MSDQVHLARRVTALVILACLGFPGLMVHAAEQTFVLRNYDLVRDRRYLEAVDFEVRAAKEGEYRAEWVGYGGVPLQRQPYRAMATEFDLGTVPRGEVKKAALRYSFRLAKAVAAGNLELHAWRSALAAPGARIAAAVLPAQTAGARAAVEFDVTEAVRAATSHVGFLLLGAFPNDACVAVCGGRDGPWARATARRPLEPAERPTLTVIVELPDTVPPLLVPRYAGLSDEVRFGPAEGLTYTLVEQPSGSVLTSSEIAAGLLRPDAEGRYVVRGMSGDVAQYATVQARRVVTAHPRLEMPAVAPARLRALREARDPRWITLAGAADRLAGAGPRAPAAVDAGYMSFGYLSAIETLSLAYVVAGQERHAARCKELVARLIKMSLPGASRDAGYAIRTHGRAVPLAFDRLYDCLTEDEKFVWIDEVNYWLAWYAQLGYQSDGPAGGNYFSGYFAALSMTAYATYQDNPRGYLLVDHARDLFEVLLQRQATAGYLRGGDNPEGRYAGNYFDTWFRYLINRQTAGGQPPIAGFVWPREVVHAQIHRTRPDGKTFYDYGAWRDTEPSWVIRGIVHPLPFLLAGTKEGAYAQYLLTGGSARAWSLRDLILQDPERPASFWGAEPLSYFSRGLCLATMRSSWQADAVWASFQSAGPHSVDHQHWDAGHWEIYRGKDPLVVDPWSDDEGMSTIFHNCLVVHSNKQINPYDPRQSNAGGQTLAFEDAGAYVYTVGDFARHYNWHGRAALAEHRRQFLYLRPNLFVLLDYFVLADPSFRAASRIHFAAEPVIDSDAGTVIVRKGGSKLWARVFSVPPAEIRRLDGPHQEKAVDIAPANPTGLGGQAGPQLIVTAMAALGSDEAPPAVSFSIEPGSVVVHFSGAREADVRLVATGAAGLTVTVNGKTHVLAGEIRQAGLE